MSPSTNHFNITIIIERIELAVINNKYLLQCIRTREYTEIVQLLQEKVYSWGTTQGGLKPAVIASWAPP